MIEMENSGNKKSAQQRTLQNASKLNRYQMNLYIYHSPKPTIWQRVKEALSHE